MGLLNKIDFVRNEIKDIPNINKKPSGGISRFCSRIGYAISLAFKEKEIFFFSLLQWVSIGLGYLLWVQILNWIPEEVWRSTNERSDGISIVDMVLLVWSFFCIGITAFPIGVLTGCMGAAHFLHKQNKESTIATCLKISLSQSWSLWTFHWIDGWITINQIFDRIPGTDSKRTPAEKALSESLYYSWKLGVAGILPSIITGNSLIKSGKNSILFVKDNFLEIAALRSGYSALCWIIGIGSYVGCIPLFIALDIVPEGDELSSYVGMFYFWAAIPILIAAAIIMLLLRPIYVLALCDLYSEHLAKKGEDVDLSESPARGVGAIVTFSCFCIILAIVYLYRNELGIVEMLSTPYTL